VTTSIVNMKGNVIRDKGLFACALSALDRGDYLEAEAEFSALLGRGGWTAAERAFLVNKRGVARVALGRRELARADFEEALQAKASHAPALTNLGNLLLEEGDLEAAIARYRSAIEADPDYPIAHLNLSVAYKRTGRRAEGVRELRLAQRLEQRASSASRFWRRVLRR
jgi:lipoprotein NlpI